jgi:hypothetical protein
MTHAQSAKAFTIYIAKREYKSWQREYRSARRDLNKYAGPVTRSISWTIFNTARKNYLRSMAQLRCALKVAI